MFMYKMYYTFFLLQQVRDKIMMEEYTSHRKYYTGNTADIMDVLVGAISGKHSSVHLTDQQRSSLDLKCLLLSVFTLFMAGKTSVRTSD